MKKILTKILLFFIDKELFFKNTTSKQEFRGQKLLNKEILQKINDLEKFYKNKYGDLHKSMQGINIFIQNSYTPKSQFCLIQYTNEKGEPAVLINDLSKLEQSEVAQILNILKKTSNVVISNL